MDIDRSRSKGKAPAPQCFKCGKTDHFQRDCPQPMYNVRTLEAEDIAIYIDQLAGHLANLGNEVEHTIEPEEVESDFVESNQ